KDKSAEKEPVRSSRGCLGPWWAARPARTAFAGKCSGVHNAATHDFVVAVAAHEEHLECRALYSQSLEDLRAGHASHDDISDEQVDGGGGRLRDCECFLPTGGREDGVAMLFERVPGQPSHAVFVLDEQDLLAPRCECFRSACGLAKLP